MTTLIQEPETERARHPETAIVGGASAETNDNLDRSAGGRVPQHFADSRSRGAHRVSFARRELTQPGDRTHFHDGQARLGQPCITGWSRAIERVARRNDNPLAASSRAN